MGLEDAVHFGPFAVLCEIIVWFVFYGFVFLKAVCLLSAPAKGFHLL